METETQSRIEKIKKLLALANAAGTPAEAEAAFGRAAEMMTKYGIEQAHIQATQTKEERAKSMEMTRSDTSDRATRTKRPHYEPIASILRECFNVEVVSMRSHRLVDGEWTWLHFSIILGEKSDVEFASYAYTVLEQTFSRLLSEYHRANPSIKRSPRVYIPFFQGLAVGFIRAYEEAQAREAAQHAKEDVQSYALVLVDKREAVEAFTKQTFPLIRYVSSRSTIRNLDAFRAGVEAGKTIKVNRALS